MQVKQHKWVKRSGRAFVTVFAAMNIIAAFHAWKFTHFSPTAASKVEPEQMSTLAKLSAIAFGVKLPRPINSAQPSRPFEVVKIRAEKMLEAWHLKTASAKGTILIFHGYGGDKSGMLDKSDEFLRLGYNTLLVDFRGSGGSEGNQTTIGCHEAAEVKACFDFIQKTGEQNIILFGTSMGAAAVMKAVSEYRLDARCLIVECPFGTMYEATCARFRAMGVPEIPMAGLLVFWGGIENGFWAFSHNPASYAKNIHCPTLLLYGEQDLRVGRGEIEAIFNSLQGEKTLETYPTAGHENYLNKYRDKWVRDITFFLQAQQGR